MLKALVVIGLVDIGGSADVHELHKGGHIGVLRHGHVAHTGVGLFEFGDVGIVAQGQKAGEVVEQRRVAVIHLGLAGGEEGGDLVARGDDMDVPQQDVAVGGEHGFDFVGLLHEVVGGGAIEFAVGDVDDRGRIAVLAGMIHQPLLQQMAHMVESKVQACPALVAGGGDPLVALHLFYSHAAAGVRLLFDGDAPVGILL